MNITEIIGDALVYPLNNIKALVVYVILGIIAGIAVGGGIIGIVTGANLNNALLANGTGIIGFIIAAIMTLLIAGYELDIVKYGINRDSGAPGIDIVRQIVNAIKLIIVTIVYYIIPAIIGGLLTTLVGRGILTMVVVVIVYVIFALAQFMGKCRLAKTESIGYALSIGDAIGDISRVGIIKILGTVIVSVIIFTIAVLIAYGVTYINTTVGGIILGILGVYATFFINRATGLLYSDI